MENLKLKEFLKKIKPESAREEIKNHVKERAEEYVAEGLDEDDAINKAISHMGDSKSIARGLRKAHGFYVKLAFALCIALCAALIIYFFVPLIIEATDSLNNVEIIGGADGPTAIYIATSTDNIWATGSMIYQLIIPVILILFFIVCYVVVGRKHKERKK